MSKFKLLFMSVLLVTILCSCTEDYTHWGMAVHTGHKIGKFLVDQKICYRTLRNGHLADCGGEGYYIRPITGGFEYTIYGVTDQKALAEIKDMLGDAFDEDKSIAIISMKAYKYPHDKGSTALSNEIIFQYTFRRDNPSHTSPKYKSEGAAKPLPLQPKH